MGGMALLGNSTDLTKLASESTLTSQQLEERLEAERQQAHWLNETARNLYSSFANAKGECPDIVAQNFVTILARFPVEIIEAVCDPETGIPGDQTWVASPKELREACEKRYAPILRERENELRRERQLRARREEEAQRAKRPNDGPVARYLAERRKEQQATTRPPASADTILQTYLNGKPRDRVSLHPDARAIIEAAGLEVPA